MEYEHLKSLVDSKLSVENIVLITGKTPAGVRYWLRKYKFVIQKPIRSWEINNLIEAVKNRFTYTDVIKDLGLTAGSSNYTTIKKYIKKLNLDTDHFKGRARGGGIVPPPFDKILVKNSSYCRRSLKRRLLSSNMLENFCAVCKLKPIWNKKKLVLVLDHINGINNDNRLENLRLLCPNCNSQQLTFAGRNVIKK